MKHKSRPVSSAQLCELLDLVNSNSDDFENEEYFMNLQETKETRKQKDTDYE